MIGMINRGDDTVEFYAAARQSSLYRHPPVRQKLEYLKDGRVFLDGVAVHEQPTTGQMWHDLISKILAMRMMKIDAMENASGPMAMIRRLSTKLKLTKTTSIDSAVLMNDLHEEVRDPSRSGGRRYTEMKARGRNQLPRERRPMSAPPRRYSEDFLEDFEYEKQQPIEPNQQFVTRIHIDPEDQPQPLEATHHSARYPGIEQFSLLNAVFAVEETDSGRESFGSPSDHSPRSSPQPRPYVWSPRHATQHQPVRLTHSCVEHL